MIRREVPADNGHPARWMLINQIDHARLSGRLAEHWGGAGFAPLVPRGPLLWAINHHDDGWADWDQTPGVDPASGVPRSFTEMTVDDSIRIWTASIDAAGAAGPLEGHIVAGHFCELERRGAPFRQHDPAWPHAEAFLAQYEAQMARWFDAWQAIDPTSNTRERADAALHQLQFFDALSLWFCCSPATSSDVLDTPSGRQVTITPSDTEHLRLTPWPFAVDTLGLEVPARVVPAGRYESREALSQAPSEATVLRWQLEPG